MATKNNIPIKNSDWRSVISSLTDDTEIIIFDLETTGFSAQKNEIVQIAAMKYIYRNGNFYYKDCLNQIIRPQIPISKAASDVNHLTNDILENYPYMSEVSSKIFAYFGNDIPVICGYNSDFDLRFMKELYASCNEELNIENHLDIYKMAKSIIPADSVPNFKLSTLTDIYGLGENIEYHNAFGDIIATFRMMLYLWNRWISLKNEESESFRILSCNYWNGPNHKLKRIYINTTIGKYFYDIYNHQFRIPKDNKREISMEVLREKALQFAGVEDEKAFVEKFL